MLHAAGAMGGQLAEVCTVGSASDVSMDDTATVGSSELD